MNWLTIEHTLAIFDGYLQYLRGHDHQSIFISSREPDEAEMEPLEEMQPDERQVGWIARTMGVVALQVCCFCAVLPSGMQVSGCCVSPLPSLAFYASQRSVIFVGSSSMG